MRRALPGVVLALALVFVAACTRQPEPTPADPGSLEKPALSVGVQPILGVAPLYIAIDKGFFRDAGLTVKPQEFAGSAQAVRAMLNGEIDIVFSNYIALFNTQAGESAKLRVIAEGSSSAPNSFGIFVMPNSPIDQTSDLAGKKIAVNTKGDIATVLTNETLKSAAVDTATINYIEMPFTSMAAALERGEVDAAFLAEPFITQVAAQLGVIRIVDVGVGSTDGLPIDGYAATDGWVKQHPKTAAAFHRAIQRASQAATDRAETEKVITTYAKVDPKMAPLVAPLQYPTSTNATRLQRVADLMRSQGLLNSRLDVGAMTGVT